MVKSRFIIIASGALVLIGIAMSVYQSQITVENLSSQQQNLAVGNQTVITKDMNSTKNFHGVYAVQITDFKDDDKIKIDIVDPYGTYLITKMITKNTEESFNIPVHGIYKLQIENDGQREVQVLGILGYYPEGIDLMDKSAFVVLIIGLSGLAIGIMFLIRSRRRTDTN